MSNLKQQSKTCPSCGLAFHNRKKWQSRGLWESIVYCSARCRNIHSTQKRATFKE